MRQLARLRHILARVVMARRFVPVVVMIAAALRLGWIDWVLHLGLNQVSDAAWYMESAADIAAGNGYVINGVPTAYWPVGYPGFLAIIFAIFGAGQLPAMIANVLLHAATLILSYAIARRLFDSERTGRITLLLLALHLNGIAYASLLMSENLFLPLMLLATWLMMKGKDDWKWGIASGLAYGAAALVKPQALLLPAIALLGLRLVNRKREPAVQWRRLALASHAMMILVLLPWMQRNYELYGRYGVISNNDGINLLIGNNIYATGAYETTALDSLHERSFPRNVWFDAQNEYHLNVDARTTALKYVGGNPFRAVSRAGWKLWHLYRADTEGFSINERGMNAYGWMSAGGWETPQSAIEVEQWKPLAELYWVALIMAFAVGLWKRLKEWKDRDAIRSLAIPLLMIVYFTAIPLVYFGDGRFHAPIVPWIAMVAAGRVKEEVGK